MINVYLIWNLHIIQVWEQREVQIDYIYLVQTFSNDNADDSDSDRSTDDDEATKENCSCAIV